MNTPKKGWKEIPIAGNIVVPGSSEEYKTGNWRSFRPVWDSRKCIQCLACPINCPEDSIKVKDGKRLETNLDSCKGCGICANVCPVKCIKMEEESKFQE